MTSELGKRKNVSCISPRPSGLQDTDVRSSSNVAGAGDVTAPQANQEPQSYDTPAQAANQEPQPRDVTSATANPAQAGGPDESGEK